MRNDVPDTLVRRDTQNGANRGVGEDPRQLLYYHSGDASAREGWAVKYIGLDTHSRKRMRRGLTRTVLWTRRSRQ